MRCPKCNSDRIRFVETVIVTHDYRTTHESGTVVFEDTGEIHWDSAMACDKPGECRDCDARFDLPGDIEFD